MRMAPDPSGPLPPPPAQAGGRKHVYQTLTRIGVKPFIVSARPNDNVYISGPDHLTDHAALLSLHSDGHLGALVTVAAGPEPLFGLVGGARHAPLVAVTAEGPVCRNAWESAVEVLRAGHEEGVLPVVLHHDGSTEAQALAVVLLATHCIVAGVGPSRRSLPAALNAVKLRGLLRARPQPLHLALGEASLVSRGWYDKHAALVAGGGEGEWACFVGDRYAAASRGFMEHHGITRVVNCGAANGLPNHFEHCPPFLQYRTLHSNDMDLRIKSPAEQWSVILPFLRQAQEEGARTLIHCVAGINRSVTTCALYLVHSGAFDRVRDAVVHIKVCRPQAGPQERYVVWAEKYLASASGDAAGAVEQEESDGRARRPSRSEKRAQRAQQREERKNGRSGQMPHAGQARGGGRTSTASSSEGLG